MVASLLTCKHLQCVLSNPCPEVPISTALQNVALFVSKVLADMFAEVENT